MSGRGSWLGVLLLLLRMRGSSDCAPGFASAFACRYDQVEVRLMVKSYLPCYIVTAALAATSGLLQY